LIKCHLKYWEKRNLSAQVTAMADAIGQSSLPFEAAAQDTVSLIFEVSDVDEATQELKAKGVVF